MRELGICGTRDFLVRSLPGGFGPLPLGVHGPIELRGIESDALIAQDVADEIEWQAEGVVKAKRFFAGEADSAVGFLLCQKRRKFLIELAQADVDGVGEALLFVADDFEQLGIRAAHAFGDLLGHFKKKRALEAQHSSVAHGAANDFAQDVAAAFVGGHDAIADKECGSAAVIGEDP